MAFRKATSLSAQVLCPPSQAVQSSLINTDRRPKYPIRSLAMEQRFKHFHPKSIIRPCTNYTSGPFQIQCGLVHHQSCAATTASTRRMPAKVSSCRVAFSRVSCDFKTILFLTGLQRMLVFPLSGLGSIQRCLNYSIIYPRLSDSSVVPRRQLN